MTSEELAILLRSVWGVDSSAELAMGDTALRRSSPSGGGLHPIEVYPIIRRVEGVPPASTTTARATTSSSRSLHLAPKRALG